MYNLGFDTAYDKEIIKKITQFQKKQDSNPQRYIPSFSEPTITTHSGNRKSKKQKD
jgi:hypothetical protein